jgi:succinoglycan biosynthesis transport protein ExoP
MRSSEVAQAHREEGHGRQGAASNGASSSSGEAALSVDDPRTRLLLENLLHVLSTDGEATTGDKPRGSIVRDVWSSVRRRWKPMLVIFALSLVAISWKLRPTGVSYVSTATMLLPRSAGGSSTESALSLLGGQRDAPGGALDTQIAIIESRPFIEQAKRVAKGRLQKQGRPTTGVDFAGIDASAPTSPELIDITVTSPDSRSAVVLANAVVDVYDQRLVTQGNSTQRANLEFVGNRVREVEKQLQNAKRELQNFKEKTNTFDIASALARNDSIIQELSNKARSTRIEAEAGETGQTVLNDAITQSLQQNAATAKLKYETVLRDFYETSPEARAAEADWRAAQAQVDRRVATLVRQSQQEARDSARELAEARRSAANLPQVEFRLSQLQSKVEQLTSTYRDLNTRYTALNLSKSAKASSIEPVSPAIAANPVSRTWSRAILTGMLCALVFAGLCCVVLEQLDRSLHSVSDLEPLLPAAVLGTMPLLRGRSERRLAQMTGAQPMAPQVLEACRIIRSNLSFATMDAPAQTILITSAAPGEGKSLSALNLATVTAFDGRRVLLLDCDLRRPSQHSLNGLALEPGFTNLLSGETDLDGVLQSTNVPNLSVITAGTLPLNPPELLGSSDTRSWLQTFKERFDVIIIDSPPTLALTDAQVLCSQVDGVVMIVAADSTAKEEVQRAQAMLRHAGGRLLGAVFNKVRKGAAADTYTYGTYGANLLERDRRLGESVGTLTRH